MKEEQTVVKADPGWSVAVYLEAAINPDTEEKYDAHVSYHAIIAWIIVPGNTLHEVYPVTTDGSNWDHYWNFWGYKRPDGLFECPNDGPVNIGLEMFMNWCREQSEARKRTKAQKKTA